MPSITKTLLVAVAATTGALASLDHQQLLERELIDGLDNELITRDEADHIIDIWAREADEEPLHVARDIADNDIVDALIARSDYDHLDDIYARDLHERDLQIRSDIEIAFHDHEGLFSRSLEQQDAVLRVRELAARDPELFQLYRRGSKLWGFAGAIGGALIAPKGHRLKGAALGGVAGWGAHKIGSAIGKKRSRDNHDDDHHEKRAPYGNDGDSNDFLGGLMGNGGSDYRRRDIDDPEIWEWE